MKRYTSAGLARTLGMDTKEIEQFTKSGVIRKGLDGNGLYRLEESAQEIIQEYKRPEQERESVDYATERAKLMRIKRLNEEYDLQLKKGELYYPDDIKMIMSKTLVSFKSRLSAIPTRAAPQIAKMSNSSDIMDLLKHLIDEALEELSDFDRVFKEEQDGTGEE